MRSETADVVRLEDYAPTPYRIDTVYLDVKLSPRRTDVRARIRLERRAETPEGTPLVLDGDGLELKGLALNGLPLLDGSYEAAPDRLVISVPPSGPFELEIRTEINPEENTTLMGLYRSSGTYCTQCEAEGFRRITYFLDRPDVLAVYTTRLEARKGDAPVLLGNGNLVEAGDISGTDRHFAIWNDPHPKPSYLFALVAGDLAKVSDTYTTGSGKNVDLGIYVEHGREGQCGWAMDSLKRSMAWDEELFGCEYDLDVFNIVAVSDFNMGAMENKGLNIFNDKYVLADPETATDQDYANVEAVIAHEYFHNWTGNRITCRDWFQLCLKEGLTVFRDQEFSSDMRSRPVKRISDVRMLKSHQFPEDAGPLAHPVRPRTYKEINNFYTATVYEKGAEVVRMLKTVLGAEAFRKGMDLYFSRHDGEATTIEAFLTCFAEASGKSLGQFALWYEQAGTPLVKAVDAYDEVEKTYTLTLSQKLPGVNGQPAGKPAVIPVRYGLVGPNGADMFPAAISGGPENDGVLHLTEPEQTFVFSGIAARPIPSLFREFSAPVRFEPGMSARDLAFLARHDSDPFNRWQALQAMASQDLIKLTSRARHDRVLKPDAALITAFGDLLANGSLDPAFKALALKLPSEADIAREIGQNVDPDAILKAINALRTAIGRELIDALSDAIAGSGYKSPYSPDATSAGQRALANLIQSYLARSGVPGQDELIAEKCAKADNMTDRIAALTLLVHENSPQAPGALEAFRERHKNDPLALDKWLTVQATAPLNGTLATVKALTAHPVFDFSNPNKVRSLIHAFATGNQSQFTASDGKGFEFIAETALALDKTNPQVAARLLSSFRSWKALEKNRADLAKAALVTVSDAKTLSRDSRDIVERCLQ